MRALLSIFLAISLSWVTTGYACSMDRLAGIRAVCCCPHHHEAMSASHHDSQGNAAAEDRCCDVVISVALDPHQPAVAQATHAVVDISAAGLPKAVAWLTTPPRLLFVTVSPPARGPPGFGTRTYLATSRLRL